MYVKILNFSRGWHLPKKERKKKTHSLKISNKLNTFKESKLSRCVPELALEVVSVRDVLIFTGASGACSEGLPLRVKELIAHLHDN